MASRSARTLAGGGAAPTYIRATAAADLESRLWLAVKRVESVPTKMEATMHDLQAQVVALKAELAEITKQFRKANAVIIRLVQDTVDYDTLKQSNHAYTK